jgi:sulfur-carrier protein
MAPNGSESRTVGTTAPALASVTVRFWAAARAATGVDSEVRSGATVGDVVDAAVAEHPDLARVAQVATFLLDGRKVGRDARVSDGGTVEVLPPFAGG